jgi:hypothetical protein
MMVSRKTAITLLIFMVLFVSACTSEAGKKKAEMKCPCQVRNYQSDPLPSLEDDRSPTSEKDGETIREGERPLGFIR